MINQTSKLVISSFIYNQNTDIKNKTRKNTDIEDDLKSVSTSKNYHRLQTGKKKQENKEIDKGRLNKL